MPSDDALAAAIAERDKAWERVWTVRGYSRDVALENYRLATTALRAICPHDEGSDARGYGVPVCIVCGEQMDV